MVTLPPLPPSLSFQSESAGFGAFHDVEELRKYSPPHGRLPGRLPGPEPGRLRDQHQPAGIEPNVEVRFVDGRFVAGRICREC